MNPANCVKWVKWVKWVKEISQLHCHIHRRPRLSKPVPPRAAGLSPDIDTVVLKALQKAPADRYATIERFADDVRRLLDERPILARPVPAWRRARLWMRRHPQASVASCMSSAATRSRKENMCLW